ncbi:hypothetical protein D3C81_1416910 [compost metagenome]
MAATLGTDLVFDVDGGSAELAHRAHGTRHVERRGAKPGVDIHQQRQVADVGDAAHVGEHVIQGVDAQVRQAQRAGGHAATGQVDRLEACAFGQQRVVGVDRADHLQRMLVGDGFAEQLTGSLVTHDLPRCVTCLWVAPW